MAMNRKTVFLLSSVLIFCFLSSDLMSAPVKDPVGKWKFTAPGAPYGYDRGIIEISKDDDEYIATLSFEGMSYKYSLEKCKFEEEKLSFGLYLDGEDIFVLMTFTEDDKLSGKASYSQGEISIHASREKEE